VCTRQTAIKVCPTAHPIQNRLVDITRKALSTPVPSYIDELLQRQVTTQSLWSTDAPRLSVPWTRTEIAKRTFCLAAPNVHVARAKLKQESCAIAKMTARCALYK